MKFYIYHLYGDKIFSIIGHNTTDRIYDINEKSGFGSIKCKYYSTDIEFVFTDNTTNTDGYHLIIVDILRRYQPPHTFTSPIQNIYREHGFPKCFTKETDWFLDNLDFSKKWILMYSMGENLFINSTPDEYRKLNTLASKVQFFSDNALTTNSNPILEKNNFKNCISNDILMWNFLAKIRWSYEFKEIFSNLNKPYKIGFSARKPKILRFQLLKELSNLDNPEIFLNQTNSLFGHSEWKFNDTNGGTIFYEKDVVKLKNVNLNQVHSTSKNDFSDLVLTENNANSMEFDYLFRVMPKAGIQILDETHSYCDNPSIPMNLTEKTYLFLMANIPFIPTNIYPLEVIENLISDVKYPYYDDIVKISGDAKKITRYVVHVLNNYDEYETNLKKWVSEIHSTLLNEVETKNSMIEQLLKSNL